MKAILNYACSSSKSRIVGLGHLISLQPFDLTLVTCCRAGDMAGSFETQLTLREFGNDSIQQLSLFDFATPRRDPVLAHHNSQESQTPVINESGNILMLTLHHAVAFLVPSEHGVFFRSHRETTRRKFCAVECERQDYWRFAIQDAHGSNATIT